MQTFCRFFYCIRNLLRRLWVKELNSSTTSPCFVKCGFSKQVPTQCNAQPAPLADTELRLQEKEGDKIFVPAVDETEKSVAQEEPAVVDMQIKVSATPENFWIPRFRNSVQ